MNMLAGSQRPQWPPRGQPRKKFVIMHLTNNRLKASADVADERRFNSLICENQRHLRIKIRIVCELHNPKNKTYIFSILPLYGSLGNYFADWDNSRGSIATNPHEFTARMYQH